MLTEKIKQIHRKAQLKLQGTETGGNIANGKPYTSAIPLNGLNTPIKRNCQIQTQDQDILFT